MEKFYFHNYIYLTLKRMKMIVKRYYYLLSEITIICKSFIQKKTIAFSFDDGSIDRFQERNREEIKIRWNRVMANVTIKLSILRKLFSKRILSKNSLFHHVLRN